MLFGWRIETLVLAFRIAVIALPPIVAVLTYFVCEAITGRAADLARSALRAPGRRAGSSRPARLQRSRSTTSATRIAAR